MSRIVIAAALALAVTLPAVSAQAQSIRTYVSITGSDSNPCSLTQPCRHFQAAVNATSVGGEVDALDPGGYGSLTISQAVTIDGQGWSYLAPPNNGNAITINAVSGNVTLRGLSLNGVGTTNTNGIVFNTGDSLTVTNCVVQNFGYSGSGQTTGNGILLQPASGTINFAITNTTVSNNGWVGVYYYGPPSGSATANGAIDHVVATNNDYGIAISTAAGGGSTKAAISNSVASNNDTTGIYIINEAAQLAVSIDSTEVSGNASVGIDGENAASVMVRNSTIANNGGIGLEANGTSATIRVTRSTITGNNIGWANISSGVVLSYDDNNIDGDTNTDTAPSHIGYK
jgi:hypothetical protein